MSYFRSLMTAGAVLGGLIAGIAVADAAPALPQTGLNAGADMVETARTTTHERQMRRTNTMRHGNPNARNPERPGYKQQLGGTTNGPRY